MCQVGPANELRLEWGCADAGTLEDKTGSWISVFFFFFFWQGTAFESPGINLGFVRAVGEKVTKQPC